MVKKKEASKVISGKYLTFNLARELYGVAVDSILQIIAIPSITQVPKTPEYVRGVINLRGKIIPVLDLRLKFGLPFQTYSHRTAIIIIKLPHLETTIFIGIIVDLVIEVVDIQKNQIEPKPDFGMKLDTAFIIGMVKMKEKVITLLNIQEILTKEEMVLIENEDS